MSKSVKDMERELEFFKKEASRTIRQYEEELHRERSRRALAEQTRNEAQEAASAAVLARRKYQYEIPVLKDTINILVGRVAALEEILAGYRQHTDNLIKSGDIDTGLAG